MFSVHANPALCVYVYSSVRVCVYEYYILHYYVAQPLVRLEVESWKKTGKYILQKIAAISKQ